MQVTQNADSVSVTFDRQTAWIVRNALMTYQSVFENVLADVGQYDPDLRRDRLYRLVEAELALERALAHIDSYEA